MSAPSEEKVSDTTACTSWGWIATIYGIDGGYWLDPTTASQFLGVSTRTLRYWSDRGVISRIQWEKGHHRRYLMTELYVVRRLTLNHHRPTLYALRWYINTAQKYGLVTRSASCEGGG